MEDLSKVPCDCGQEMEEVIYADQKKRTGWYCPTCKDFRKAIGRERHLSNDQLYRGRDVDARS